MILNPNEEYIYIDEESEELAAVVLYTQAYLHIGRWQASTLYASSISCVLHNLII